MLFDAHNHLQDHRLDAVRPELMRLLPMLGVAEAVVNGSAEDDWEDVARIAREHPWVRPAFGLHPWYVKERTDAWQEALRRYLTEFPRAAVGEIGLDRWIENPDLDAQVQCFRLQLGLAVELDRPVTIHCLRAWGLLEEQLRAAALPKRGFLLHSYGGPEEMIPRFASLGGYFSLSPYFGHERKARQLAVFAAMPLERLLVETDAPDMWPPEELNPNPLQVEGRPVNHPANLSVSYELLAGVRGMEVSALEGVIAENHRRLFGNPG
jgi:TatD DNase family protein